MKFLIDTNILIQLEDNRTVEPILSSLVSRHDIYVSKASIEDIARDSNSKRRDITTSKLAKYSQIPRLDISQYPDYCTSDNDRVDYEIVECLKRGVVDYLVTEDRNIHKKAPDDLTDKILYKSQLGNFVGHSLDRNLPYIEDKQCVQVDIKNPFFDSLKTDYLEFNTWWRKCVSEQRKCWCAYNGDGELSALAIYKQETDDTRFCINGEKVLKICTFKVSEHHRGLKLGEHLIKQILDYAIRENFTTIFMTAYPQKQAYLIDFLSKYGFQNIGKTPKSEHPRAEQEVYLASYIGRINKHIKDALNFHEYNYPHIMPDSDTYLVPIQPQYYEKLFPEYYINDQLSLFDGDKNKLLLGNAIRKKYITHSKIKKLKAGDTLLFYVSSPYSQIYTAGVVVNTLRTDNHEQALSFIRDLSVYSDDDINQQIEKGEILIIEFSLSQHMAPFPTHGLIRGNSVPQSISRSLKSFSEIDNIQTLGFIPK